MERIIRIALRAIHYVTVAIGIMLLPIAIVSNKLGITLPIDQLINKVENVYQAVN